MDDARARQALSFGAVAERYDRVRPSYAVEAIRWAVGDEPARVIDLGAGTGIFSRQLAAAGHTVVPVEPDTGMRARLAATGLTPQPGSAEQIPAGDGSADAVTAAQAYHWFDTARAHEEIARVLRPGGVFCPLWNVRDDTVPWISALSDVLADGGGDGSSHAAWTIIPDFGEHFEPAERALFRHSTHHTADSLVELVRSRSYYLTADAARRAELEQAIRHLAASHPDLAGRESFELPYVTVVYRARRRPVLH